MKNLREKMPALLCGGAALLLSMHVVAAEPSVSYGADGLPRATISIADLDLDEQSDVRALYERVQEGATAVCRSAVQTERRARHRIPAGWRRACYESAVEDAVRSVGSPLLTALHRGASEMIAER